MQLEYGLNSLRRKAGKFRFILLVSSFWFYLILCRLYVPSRGIEYQLSIFRSYLGHVNVIFSSHFSYIEDIFRFAKMIEAQAEAKRKAEVVRDAAAAEAQQKSEKEATLAAEAKRKDDEAVLAAEAKQKEVVVVAAAAVAAEVQHKEEQASAAKSAVAYAVSLGAGEAQAQIVGEAASKAYLSAIKVTLRPCVCV